MKNVSDEEIKSIILGSNEPDGSDAKVTITREKYLVRIHAENMSEYIPLTFKILSALSKAFGTMQIDETSRHSSGGCESCDYGSCYEWTLTITDDGIGK